jgi:hypothetical protein
MSRIVIARDVTRLRVIHRQRVLRQGDADPAPVSDEPLTPPHLQAAGRAGWQRLVETEYESVVIASWMTSGLARLGAPLDILGAFGRIVEDEIRHVDLCAQLVEAFGQPASVPRGATPPFPVAPEGASAQEVEYELLGGLIGFFCVFEHLSAHVFREALDAAKHPVAQWAIAEIHRDEAFHGAFGFETAKLFVPRWSEELRTRLGVRVADDIRRFETRLGGPLTGPQPPVVQADEDALSALGLLPPPHLLSIFYQAVRAELLPRLDELSIPVPLRLGPTP